MHTCIHTYIHTYKQDRGEERESGRQRAKAGQREHAEREGLGKTKKYRERWMRQKETETRKGMESRQGEGQQHRNTETRRHSMCEGECASNRANPRFPERVRGRMRSTSERDRGQTEKESKTKSERTRK